MAVLWILVGWVACVLTALTLGLAFFRLLRVRLSWAEQACLGFLTGSALLSMGVLGIAALGLAYEGVFLAIGMLALAALIRFRRILFPSSGPVLPRVHMAWRVFFLAGLLAYGLVYFRQALSPEMSPDAMEYHLGLISQFSRAHRLLRFVDIYAGLPEGIEMLYLFGFSIGRNSTGSLIHFTFLADLALLMALYGRRFGFPVGGMAAALLVFASPLVGADGTAAYNDVGLAAVMFGATYLLALWWKEESAGLLIACGATTGFALGVKYTAAPFAVFVVIAMAIGIRGRWRRFAPSLALTAFCLCASLGPYLIRNALWFHNPIVFFGNSVFRNPYFHVSFERRYIADQAHLNNLEWSDMPLQLTLGGNKVEGCFGAAFLGAPLLLAAVIWPQGRFLALAALAAAFPFPHDRSSRFLIPALPFVALAMTFVLRRLPGWRVLLPAIALLQAIACWPALLDKIYTLPGWHVQSVPWDVVFRLEPEGRWLTRNCEEYEITRAIDRSVPPNEPILTLGAQIANSYTDRRVFVDFQSAFGERLAGMFFTYWYSPRTRGLRWRFRFPPLLAREVRLVQTASDDEAQWSANEVELEAGGRSVVLPAGSHPYAWPNPWDAQLAFDGIFVSRWRTWEAIRPGMYLGVKLGAPTSLDGVDVLVFPDEWKSRIALRIQADGGDWRNVAQPTLEVIPIKDLRKQAVLDIKRQGVKYILLSNFDWRGAQRIAEARDWGLSPVVRTANYALYQID